MTLDPTTCPRFGSCSAPVCPLFPHSLAGPHVRGDKVCPHLLEAVKSGGGVRLSCYLPEDLTRAVVASLPLAITLGGDIARALRRASGSGSRIEAAAKARAGLSFASSHPPGEAHVAR